MTLTAPPWPPNEPKLLAPFSVMSLPAAWMLAAFVMTSALVWVTLPPAVTVSALPLTAPSCTAPVDVKVTGPPAAVAPQVPIALPVFSMSTPRLPAPNDVVVAVIDLVAVCVTPPAEPVAVVRLVAVTSSSAMLAPTVTDTAAPVAPKLPRLLVALPTVTSSVVLAVTLTAPGTVICVPAACVTTPELPPEVVTVRPCVAMAPSTRSFGLVTVTVAAVPVVVAASWVRLLFWVARLIVASVVVSSMLADVVVWITPVCVTLPCAATCSVVALIRPSAMATLVDTSTAPALPITVGTVSLPIELLAFVSVTELPPAFALSVSPSVHAAVWLMAKPFEASVVVPPTVSAASVIKPWPVAASVPETPVSMADAASIEMAPGLVPAPPGPAPVVPALRLTLSDVFATLAVIEPPVNVMLPWAFRFSVEVWPLVRFGAVIGAVTLMSPLPVPLPVLTLTVMPLASAPLRVVLLSTDAAPFDVYVFVPVLMLFCAAVEMVRSRGSISHVPPVPCAAPRSTEPLACSSSCDEVSSAPPLPPALPPRAVMAPVTCVRSSDHSTTLPPLPLAMALALMTPPAKTVWLAFLSPSAPAPCQSPPTRTTPPPASPETSTVASNRPTLAPVTLTVPPVWPAPLPLASSVPVTWTTPELPPSSVMTPLREPMECACTMPSTLTTVPSNASVALAEISTRPPSACTMPPERTSAAAVGASTDTDTRSLPVRFMVTRLPATRAAVPPSATMVPVLDTCAPASATNPALITPWLSTAPPAPANT